MWVQAICCYYFAFVSILIAILRLSEPIVMETFKRDLTCCGRARANQDVGSFSSSDSFDARKGIADSDVLSDTLNSFLTSSLNVELVYTILKGIRRIVKTPDLETWKNGQIPENATNDFSMRLILDNIKIRNFKIWENAH